MFASKFFNRAAHSARKFSTSASGYSEKSFNQVWLSDSGTYPVLTVIAIGIIFPSYWGMSTVALHPDCRVTKGSRKSIFRGELKGTTA